MADSKYGQGDIAVKGGRPRRDKGKSKSEAGESDDEQGGDGIGAEGGATKKDSANVRGKGSGQEVSTRDSACCGEDEMEDGSESGGNGSGEAGDRTEDEDERADGTSSESSDQDEISTDGEHSSQQGTSTGRSRELADQEEAWDGGFPFL